ncbi:MAG: hypothetical protein ACXAD7_02975 [Candidatus Kariarchaeaceae archaeon]|jgi:hypothetical protein
MTFPKIRYSKLKRYNFVDINDVEIGSLEDIVVDKEGLFPTHLILGAGFFEEFLEELGKKGNIDELAPFDIISMDENDDVIIGKPVEELITTNEKGYLPISGYKYADLMKFIIKSQDETLDADLVDIELDGLNSRYFFRFHDLQDKLQQSGYGQRFEVSFLASHIKIEVEVLLIPSTLDELLESIKNNIEPKMRGKSLYHWEKE